jgi:4-amino-4-deoxy-L-arabinose transferase-like glycosyltransferase
MQKSTFYSLIWVLIGAIFFLPYLGGVHLFDWDEINFAEIAREMIVLDNYLEMHINFVPFMEKPPLFFWMQTISMKLFGINEFAARLPNAIAGILVLPLLFRLGSNYRDALFGHLWALAWLGSLLPHLYFRSGIIDPVFNLFIFLSIWLIIDADRKRDESTEFSWILILAAVFSGLAVLTKGPVAWLLIGLTAVIVSLWKKRIILGWKNIIAFVLISIAVPGAWFTLIWMKNGPDFLLAFTIRQWELLTSADAGHAGFLGYHFVVLLIGCFPASIFALDRLYQRKLGSDRETLWMSILLFVVLILFTLVKTKIIHYSSMAYYPLTFLAAVSLHQFIRKERRVSASLLIGLLTLGMLISIALFTIVYIGNNPEILSKVLERDVFARENFEALVIWPWLIAIVPLSCIVLLVYVVVKGKKNAEIAFPLLFAGFTLLVCAIIYIYPSRIEQYTQHSNIEFWKSVSDKAAYYSAYRYKTYAVWYYSAIQPHADPNAPNNEWLLKGRPDRPVYISVRANDLPLFIEEVTDARFLYNSNGFHFFVREVPEN